MEKRCWKFLILNAMVKKNSNVGLLKLIAMFMIFMSHFTPDFGDPNAVNYISSDFASLNPQILYIIFAKYLGQLGVCIFVICSAYFLVDRDHVNNLKPFIIEADSITIGLTTVLFSVLVLHVHFPVKETIGIVLPISRGTNWFIGCYIFYYLTVPYINKIFTCNKKRLFNLYFFTLCFFSVLQLLFKDAYYFNHLLGFYAIHVITYFLKYGLKKKYNNKKKVVAITIISGLSLIAFIIIFDVISAKLNIMHGKMQHFRYFTNPLIMLFSFGLFYLFNDKQKSNKYINELASLTLFMYLFHENNIIRQYVRPMIFNTLYFTVSYKYLVLICVGMTIAFFIIFTIISFIYKVSIHKACDKIGSKCYLLVSKIINICYSRWAE